MINADINFLACARGRNDDEDEEESGREKQVVLPASLGAAATLTLDVVVPPTFTRHTESPEFIPPSGLIKYHK